MVMSLSPLLRLIGTTVGTLCGVPSTTMSAFWPVDVTTLTFCFFSLRSVAHPVAVRAANTKTIGEMAALIVDPYYSHGRAINTWAKYISQNTNCPDSLQTLPLVNI